MDTKIIAAYPGTGAEAFAQANSEVALHWMSENDAYAQVETLLDPIQADLALGKIVIVPVYEVMLTLLSQAQLEPLVAVPTDDAFDLYAPYLTVPNPEMYRELWPAMLNNFRYRPNTYVLTVPYAQQLTDLLQVVDGQLQLVGESAPEAVSYNRPDASM